LRKIPDPPSILFVKGPVEALRADKTLAIVGTRQPSRRGKELSERFGRVASESGWVVVSGLALGCDAGAHMGSIEGRGSGVAVLAHGLDMVHPPESIKLAEELIAAGGCLVSEYPIGTLPVPSAFVRRDRLQSGLSDGVLIVEAGERGGAMHAARFARRQGRPVACLAFDDDAITSTTAAGNRRLIEEGWAVPIRDEQELLSFMQGLEPSN